MKKEKTVLAILAMVLLFGVLFIGCSNVPKIAEIAISSNPNPVSLDASDGKWHYTLQITESRGVGVTISGLKFEYYHGGTEPENIKYFDAAEFNELFETDYVSGYSSIQNDMAHTSGSVEDHYTIVTVTGTDDNGNTVEATLKIDYVVQ